MSPESDLKSQLSRILRKGSLFVEDLIDDKTFVPESAFVVYPLVALGLLKL